ncbi:hypothetical protein [Ruminococcus sp. NK3A76]|uniref:hypothetical protein n=1 Tax=Ruminococcus sp. NK3A76 TaxID=877411 RepID=UPI0012EB21F3|nr:hypothetical protein [Ruminococcus sp. NK3A76]
MDKYPINLVCQTLGISTRSYYDRKENPRSNKEKEDLELVEKMQTIFAEKL